MTITPSPIGPRGLAARCAAQGASSADAGEPRTAMPYGPDRPFSARAWVRGYNDALRRAGARMPSDVADDTPDE